MHNNHSMQRYALVWTTLCMLEPCSKVANLRWSFQCIVVECPLQCNIDLYSARGGSALNMRILQCCEIQCIRAGMNNAVLCAAVQVVFSVQTWLIRHDRPPLCSQDPILQTGYSLDLTLCALLRQKNNRLTGDILYACCILSIRWYTALALIM